MRSILLTVVLLIVVSGHSFSQTPVSPGEVSGSWAFSGSPYQVLGDIMIPNDSTLVIESGVTVEFQGHYSLDVQGRLLAKGTEADTIVFTVSDTAGFSQMDTTLGGWHGIRLFNTPSDNDSTILEYCRLEYGKAVGPNWPFDFGGAFSVVSFDKVRISHCLITNNIAGGPLSPGAGGVGVNSSDIVLTGNTISRNHAQGQGGGLYLYDSNVQFSDNRIFGNTAMLEGAGIFILGGSTLSFTGDSIAFNRTPGNGGGIIMFDVDVARLESVVISSNEGRWGGGVGAINCTLKVDNSTFEGNTALWLGGALSADYSSTEITRTQMRGNRAAVAGGAIHHDHCDLVMNASSITSNGAGSDSVYGAGGGVNVVWSQVSIVGSQFGADTATVGGALNIFNSDLQLDSLTLLENVARDYGGALFCGADSAGFGRPFVASLKRTRVRGNKATNISAGVGITATGTDNTLLSVIIDGCEFTDNEADRVTTLRLWGPMHDFVVSNTVVVDNRSLRWSPGVTIAAGAHGSLDNCLIAGNGTGSGLSITQDAHVHLRNSTIAHNADDGGWGVSMRSGSQVSLTNSIVWGNANGAVGAGTTDSLHVSRLWINHCLIEDGRDSLDVTDTLSVINWGTGNIDMNPLFEDSGSRNYHLFSGSPCIGAGIDSIEIDGAWHRAPVTDLEGNPRPSPLGTRPDLGAYEDQLTVPVGAGQDGESGIPTSYALHQNHPNPFNPTTTIGFALRDRSHVMLAVYDLLGRCVAMILDEMMEAGQKSVHFEARNLASGVYLYRLRAGSFVQTRKMVLVR